MQQKVCSAGVFSPLVSDELHWIYLVNETLAGETVIVPLLEDLMSLAISDELRLTLDQQLKQEKKHVTIYRSLVGESFIDRTSFRDDFSGFYFNLPNVTLKLFMLQAMLEGLALGALHYRMSTFSESPSARVDLRVLRDEEDHVSNSYPHFRELIRREGAVSAQDFKDAGRKINEVFSKHFNQNEIAGIYSRDFAVRDIEPALIARSRELTRFRNFTRLHIVRAKNEFLTKYIAAAQ